jgi:uncharacterized sulfatase
VPADRKIDGANVWPHLAGEAGAKPAHETFFYYQGLRLMAVRHGDWKLQISGQPPRRAGNAAAANPNEPFQPKLYDLKTDLAEAKDVAAANPETVAKLAALVAAMKDDLGTEGAAQGSRPLGRVEKPRPLLEPEGPDR